MGNVECVPCTCGDNSLPIASASFKSIDGASNRDSGKMADIMSALNGKENWVRYRTGGSQGFTVELKLSTPSKVSGVSMLVQNDISGATKGYSGIEISISSNNGINYVSVYDRKELFGTFERHATYRNSAKDFQFEKWVNHKFTNSMKATHVRLAFGAADQRSDNCVSFDGIRVES
jgi:hypothetical protein